MRDFIKYSLEKFRNEGHVFIYYPTECPVTKHIFLLCMIDTVCSLIDNKIQIRVPEKVVK